MHFLSPADAFLAVATLRNRSPDRDWGFHSLGADLKDHRLERGPTAR
jgi:hypothetical protein